MSLQDYTNDRVHVLVGVPDPAHPCNYLRPQYDANFLGSSMEDKAPRTSAMVVYLIYADYNATIHVGLLDGYTHTG